MNKFRRLVFSTLVLAAFAAGFQFVSSARAEDNPALGLTDVERNRLGMIFVYNADAVAHEAGDVVVWKDGTYDGLEVSTTTTANNPLVAGVVPYGYTLPASGWGFIQTRGYHPAITIAVANSDGDNLVTSTTAEGAGVYSVAQATGSAANQSTALGVFGVAMEATTSSTTVKGFLKCQ